MATWYICSGVSFSITIVLVFFFFRTLPDSKLWLLRQHVPLKGSNWLCPSVPRQGLFFEDWHATAKEEVLRRLKRYPGKQGERKELC